MKCITYLVNHILKELLKVGVCMGFFQPWQDEAGFESAACEEACKA